MSTHASSIELSARDVEKDAGADYAHLTNTSVQSYAWKNVTVTVKDRRTKKPKDILSNVNGIVHAGKHLQQRTHRTI